MYYKYFRKIDDCIFIGDWYVGWHSWKPCITYHECGYETGNAELHISLFGWHSEFKLPWKSKRFPNGDCDEPRWGVSIFDNKFWIYRGGNGNLGDKTKLPWITFNIPFTYSKPCCRWQVECYASCYRFTPPVWVDKKDMECKDSRHYKSIYEMGVQEVRGNYYKLKTYTYDYIDSSDGALVPCTFWVEEMEWRPKWLGWTKLFRKTHKYIEVVFHGEVGRDKGEWKGGVTACSYELLPGETPMDCIKRMERDRKFN